MKNNYILKTAKEVRGELAGKVRKMRLTLEWKQSTLAERSGVSLASLRRFEKTGQISLNSLLDIAATMGCLNDFDILFNLSEVTSIDDLEKRDQMEIPRRGRI